MPLHPSLPIPERVLSLGPAGSGKTTNWLNILKWAVRTKADVMFYVLDTDFAVPRMLTSYPEVIPYLKLYPCYDWLDYTQASKEILKHARPLQDWAIVDFIGSAWQAVQPYYVEEIFKKDIGNYFMQVRKEIDKDAKNLSALDGWVDWQVINALYRQWAQPFLFKGQYHIYATAKSEALSSEKKPTEDAQTRSLFLRHSVKPQGQKTLPFQFHTLLLNGYTPRTDARTITTIKDRERSEVAGLVVKDFTLQYLRDVAGWELV